MSLVESSERHLQDMGVDEALERFLSELDFQKVLARFQPEEIAITDSLHRITAHPVLARLSSPHFFSAAVDGLAVRAADTFAASESQPLEVPLGEEGVFVETGSPLPEGCDAVVPVHELEWSSPKAVRLTKQSNPWRNVRPVGEDVAEQEVVLPRDHRIEPVDIGAMAAAGVDKVRVYRKPRVGIVALGKTLVPVGVKPEVGQAVDTNSPTLAAMVEELGGLPHVYPITLERLEEAGAQMLMAADQCDVVFTVAGPSHGTALVARLLQDLGDRVVHGVAIKPCNSLTLGVLAGKPVIGFPFRSVSVFSAFELFVRPLMAEFIGPTAMVEEYPQVQAILAVPLRRHPGIEEMVRVKLGQVDDKVVAVAETGGASTLMSMVRASGTIRVGADVDEIPAKTPVNVRLLTNQRSLQGNILLLGTHDICYDMIRSHLMTAFPDLFLHTAATGGMAGLKALRNGLCHVAAIHLFDEDTGSYNIPFLQKEGTEPMMLVNLFSRDLGLIVAPGNPLGIKGLRDLARPEVRFINRQVGSGTRVLLDYHLRCADVESSAINGWDREVRTHMAVASAVSSGTIDAGPGISTAARTLRLDFVPCISERLDLAIPKRFYNRFPVAGLLQVIRAARFRREAKTHLADYEFSQTGQVLWES